jgi:hypothetical protein
MEIKLWEERQFTVATYLSKFKITSLADFGCGDGKLITYLIEYFSNKNLLKLKFLFGIDFCEQEIFSLTEKIKSSISSYTSKVRKLVPFKLKPKKWKEVLALNFPLLQLTVGNILLKSSEIKKILFENKVELITMIEVIEHLNADKIDLLFETLMGYYRPKYILMTTPNKEYNTVYGLTDEQTRHYDHKFEWIRAEFQKICQSQADLYGYKVMLDGIGECHNIYGHSTQMAWFCLDESQNNSIKFILSQEMNDKTSVKIISHDLNNIIYKKEHKLIRVKKFINQLYEVLQIIQLRNNKDENNSYSFSINEVFNFYTVKSSFNNIELFSKFLLKFKKLFLLRGISFSVKNKKYIYLI